ncbi:DUF1003 domain-containing protein [Phenylobacterium sp. VNQ135]|uniref:DUF1003 domain-containing protein n=1 Tax=Phenylobacterium sp. VNQ135 TaxID=3400922 RepID=UPI003C081A50
MSELPREHLSQELLGCAYAELTPIQRSVIDLIATEAPSAADPELKLDERTRGQKLADRMAAIGGSWGFIGGFALCLALWMGWNAWAQPHHMAFDPYPFIFLNLVLSTLAAVQAPIIMMSQNRAAERDRKAAEQDYIVNLRAELEIMHLHDKMDSLRYREMAEMIKRQNESLRILRKQLTGRSD